MSKIFPIYGKTVALTGATGFIGSYLVQNLVSAGANVRALTRREMVAQSGVSWVFGSLSDRATLDALCTGADAVIHAAGAIKARSSVDFFSINASATRLIAQAALDAGVKRFILLSSLAAREPHLSDYAASKRAGEDALIATLSNAIPWIILRPPAVFGPGDQETLKIFKSVKMGFAPLPHAQARTAWIHVEDLTDACIAALEYQGAEGGIWPLDDGSGGYPLQHFYQIVAQIMDVPVQTVPVPRLLLSTIALINETIAGLRGQSVMLTKGKVREICHPDWSVSAPALANIIPWKPKITLAEGLVSTLSWYREKGQL